MLDTTFISCFLIMDSSSSNARPQGTGIGSSPTILVPQALRSPYYQQTMDGGESHLNLQEQGVRDLSEVNSLFLVFIPTPITFLRRGLSLVGSFLLQIIIFKQALILFQHTILRKNATLWLISSNNHPMPFTMTFSLAAQSYATKGNLNQFLWR